LSPEHRITPGRRGPLLVVEDDSTHRGVVRRMLERRGYGVLDASNGQIALDVLRNSEPRPRLIVLDLRMPVMSGEELLDALAGDPELSRIPVLVTSARSPRIDSLKYNAPMKWLQKPWDPDAMLALIAALLTHEPQH
jgi:CheY-like chemotaxis protein